MYRLGSNKFVEDFNKLYLHSFIKSKHCDCITAAIIISVDFIKIS